LFSRFPHEIIMKIVDETNIGDLDDYKLCRQLFPKDKIKNILKIEKVY